MLGPALSDLPIASIPEGGKENSRNEFSASAGRCSIDRSDHDLVMSFLELSDDFNKLRCFIRRWRLCAPEGPANYPELTLDEGF